MSATPEKRPTPMERLEGLMREAYTVVLSEQMYPAAAKIRDLCAEYGLDVFAAPPPPQVSEATTEDRVGYLRRDVEDLRAARELLNDATDKLARRVTVQTATLAGLIERVAAVEWVNQKIPPNPLGPSFRYTGAPAPRAASEVERATAEIKDQLVGICRAYFRSVPSSAKAIERGSRVHEGNLIVDLLARLDAAGKGTAP